MPKLTVYIETTVVSYLTCQPSRDVMRHAHETLTRQWWARAALRFELYTSELVDQEASAGDPAAAASRLAALSGMPRLAITSSAVELAKVLATTLALPARARADAVHMAVSAVHGMAFLLTWNCKHLANAVLADRIERACAAAGFVAPRICTPEQLMEAP